MSQYNFDVTLDTKQFTVAVDTRESYGYFEHKTLGDGCGGGLWFEGNALADYDGVAELPNEVSDGLRAAGFVVSPDFD